MDNLAWTNDNLSRKRMEELALGRAGGYAEYVSEASDNNQSLDGTFRTTNGGGLPASTFEQEILGKATADKDDGVKSKPGDNDHQDGNDDNDDDNDDDNNGDGGGFTGSAGRSQSGAQLVCRQ
jgi:hypothetical protein